MVENYTFKVKWQFFAIFRKMLTIGGTNSYVDLNSASIYSSYNIISYLLLIL